MLVSGGFPILRNLFFHLPDGGEIVAFIFILSRIEIQGWSLVHQNLLRNSNIFGVNNLLEVSFRKKSAFTAPYCINLLQSSRHKIQFLINLEQK